MKIILTIDDFFFEIFPDIHKNEEHNSIKNTLKIFYKIENITPDVVFDHNTVVIDINFIKPLDSKKFELLVKLSEKGAFNEAIKMAQELINDNPAISEYHRVLGQVYSETGDQGKAIESLRNALRWGPENSWALLMAGNIYAKYKNDIKRAIKYYDKALELNPEDNIVYNNIGANLMQLGEKDIARKYFERALKIDPAYANTHFALALIAEQDSDYKTAFNKAITALKSKNIESNLKENIIDLAVKSAYILSSSNEPLINDIIYYYTKSLKDRSNYDIRITEDENIPTPAKIEFAENYKRDHHLVKYKPKYPAVQHLILHNLLNLEMQIKAKENNKNMLFIVSNDNKKKFILKLKDDAERLSKLGISDKKISDYLTELFHGMNRQIMNTPVDLIIEDNIYNRHQEIRPLQFLSLLIMLKDGINATTSKEIVQFSPKSILAISKIYNLINALHFKKLYNLDLTEDFKPTSHEFKQAATFYQEYNLYGNNIEPGMEFEIMKNWAKDLNLESYFNLVRENDHYKIEKSIEHKQESSDIAKEKKMKEFLETHKDKELNLAVTMYMIGALQYFKNLKKEKIKQIAYEIATLGMEGIDPNKNEYTIPSIEDTFSGYKILAYYYVSWALAIPEMLEKLQLPFDKEYKTAIQFFNLNKNK